MSDRLEQLRTTIEQARELRAEIVVECDETCYLSASVQGDFDLKVPVPRARVFRRGAAAQGRTWLTDHGFTLGENLATHTARRGADASALARLLDDALTHALQVDQQAVDASTVWPAVLAGRAYPPVDARPAEHVTAALRGIVDAGQGLVDICRGLPQQPVAILSVWGDELRVLIAGDDGGTEHFLPLDGSVDQAVGMVVTALLAHHHADDDPLFIDIFDEVDPMYRFSRKG